jgi:hypothetical protein
MQLCTRLAEYSGMETSRLNYCVASTLIVTRADPLNCRLDDKTQVHASWLQRRWLTTWNRRLLPLMGAATLIVDWLVATRCQLNVNEGRSSDSLKVVTHTVRQSLISHGTRAQRARSGTRPTALTSSSCHYTYNALILPAYFLPLPSTSVPQWPPLALAPPPRRERTACCNASTSRSASASTWPR